MIHCTQPATYKSHPDDASMSVCREHFSISTPVGVNHFFELWKKLEPKEMKNDEARNPYQAEDV